MASSSSVNLEDPGLDYTLNTVLVKIAMEITDEDLANMKYLLGGDQGTPRRVIEEITTPLKLFNHLRGRLLLSRDNILFLQAMLYHAKRIDLLNELSEFAATRENILHCYPESDGPVNGFKFVRYHVSGVQNLDRTKLEDIRSKTAYYLGIPLYFITVQGLKPTESFMVTLMIPDDFCNALCNMGLLAQQSFLCLGVDFIEVGDKTVHFKEQKTEISKPDVKLNEELQYYLKRNTELQKQLEIYQLKELKTTQRKPTDSIDTVLSLTVIATLLFNIVRQNKNETVQKITLGSAFEYFRHAMEKVEKEGYNHEIIIQLLEAHSLFVRKNILEEHRLLILQQHWAIENLDHFVRVAIFEKEKLKYLLGKNVQEPLLTDNEELLLRHLTSAMPAVPIQVEVGIGLQNDFQPIFLQMSSCLTDDEKDRLRQAFELREQEEKFLQQLNLSFIEILACTQSQRKGPINIRDFGELLNKVVNRKEFKEKWQQQMAALDRRINDIQIGTNPSATSSTSKEGPPHKKVKLDTEHSKIDEVLKNIVEMSKRMANVENMLRNPLAKLDYRNIVQEYLTPKQS